MAIKKTELYSSLWQSCDELRGGMDASQYKDYVLTFLFMKYVSDKYAGDPYAIIDIPEGGSFPDMVKLKGDKEIGDKINKIIGKLAEANDLKGVIDVADFNDEDKLGKGKEMVDRLSKLVAIFDGLDLSANRAEGDDLLGDAYEYLMRHFATESGKSKGQFYTPAEVSRILAKVVGITRETRQDKTAYDPTCGSGSLLLKVADEAPNGLTLYGQEMDNATSALARMNMILHNNPTAVIWQANTLASPYWINADGTLKRFDFAVANFPFSYKSWSNGLNPAADEFGRFEYGVPPDKNGDYAFLLHTLKSLKSTGKGAVILPHGVLFRGNTEAAIRRNLIKQGFIKGIIGLPANLFYGTGIPACIIVLDKAGAAGRDAIFMIDASKGFIKDGNKNRLRERDIHKIVDVFNNQLTLPGYARLVSFSEIEGNEYNLNIPRYIDSSEPEDRHDLTAHLNGGIPQGDIDEMDAYWQVFPSLRRTLFGPGRIAGYATPLVAANQVKATILNHPEFVAFADRSLGIYQAWQNAHDARLRELELGDDPKVLIAELAEALLARFAAVALLDKYRIYQLLLDYWAETMQDDVYLVTQDGWAAGSVLRELVSAKGEKSKETPDLTINKKKYKADLIPPALVVARYFVAEQEAIDRLQAQKEGITQELEGLLEEHGGEEGLLAEASNDSGKVTKATVTARMKQLTANSKRLTDPTEKEEWGLLKRCLQLMADEADANKDVKAAETALDNKLFAHYPKLSAAEIKTLVVADKWQATLAAAITQEIERVTQQLTTRVSLLEERYAEPLPQIVDEVADLSSKVDAHLQKDGAVMVKAGYKQTEIGVIPEDWDVVEWQEITSLVTNGFVGKAKDHYTQEDNGVTYIQGFNVEANSFNFTGIKKVTSEFHGSHQKSCLREADLLTVQTGDVGLTTIVPKHLEGSNCHALIISRIEKRKAFPWFYAHYFNSPIGRLRLKDLEVGTTMKHINVGDLLPWKVPYPRLIEEQQAIAESLSDVDGLIAGLDKLIAKKRAIKMGTMQVLLTGEKRLPGFGDDKNGRSYKQTEIGLIPEDWDVATLESVSRKGGLVRGPFGGALKKEFFVNHGYKVYEQRNAIYATTALGSYFIDSEKYQELNRFKVNPGDFIVSCSGTIGRIFRIPNNAPEGVINQALLKIVLDQNVINSQFFLSLFRWEPFQEKIIDNSHGGAMQNLVGMDIFRNTLIQLPAIEEQLAIAEVLSDIDTEITALETRRAKTQAIKQGMMQELLTGRTRLL